MALGEIKLSNNETHSPRCFIRGNESYFICDNCDKEVKESEVTKINKGRNKDYAYCEECMKKLYPLHKKVAFYNSNPIMNNIRSEALARKEYRR